MSPDQPISVVLQNIIQKNFPEDYNKRAKEIEEDYAHSRWNVCDIHKWELEAETHESKIAIEQIEYACEI